MEETQQQSPPPIFETQKYSYQSKKLPPKPLVLDAGKNLTAPTQSGVNFQFGTIIS